VKLLSVEQIRAKLSEKFQTPLDPRCNRRAATQTLRAAIQWSYDPLSDDEKDLLGALSAFTGGCNLESVTNVAGTEDEFASLEILSQLADKSLIVVDEDHGEQKRYGLLETVKEFVVRPFDRRTSLIPSARAHFRVMLDMAETAYAARATSEEAWAAVLQAERGNMLSALEFARSRDAEAYLTSGGCARMVLDGAVTYLRRTRTSHRRTRGDETRAGAPRACASFMGCGEYACLAGRSIRGESLDGRGVGSLAQTR
jgi:predicted ATPase